MNKSKNIKKDLGKIHSPDQGAGDPFNKRALPVKQMPSQLKTQPDTTLKGKNQTKKKK